MKEKRGVKTLLKQNNMGLEFSAEAKQVVSVFKSYRNSIDIYTEDKDKDKEFYIALFRRLTHGSKIKINDIYPLGSCNEVIKKCKEDIDITRKKIYIIDGDIYTQYNNRTSIQNLFVLDSYCIENYVIDEKSICKFAYQLLATQNYKKIKSDIQFKKMMHSLSQHLVPLFFYYSIQKQCVDYFKLGSVEIYMTKGYIDSDKIMKKKDEIKKDLQSKGIPEDYLNKLLEDRKNRFPINSNSLLTIVSGKDFIIPYIGHYLRQCIGLNTSNCSKEAWKFNLVKYCNLERLNNLKNAILG